MDPRIPGAFVIRHRKSRKVLHLDNPKGWNTKAPYVYDRDEEKYRKEQIWWIDVVPGGSAPTGRHQSPYTYYTISNLAFDYHLDVNAGLKVEGSKVYAFIAQQSSAWQMWRFLKPDRKGKLEKMSSNGGPFSLVPGHCDLVLRGSDCKLASSAEKDDILWELVLPAVSTPCGWVRLQNEGTGHVLSQTLVSLPPLMIPQSTRHHIGEFSEPDHLREAWSTHWKIIPVSAFQHSGWSGKWTAPRSFCIINRLTGCFLHAQLTPFGYLSELNGHVCQVGANEVKLWDCLSKVWTVEKAGGDLWTILSNKDEELGECEVKFRNGWLPQLLGEDMEEGRRRWRIVELEKYATYSEAAEKNDTNPPAYDAAPHQSSAGGSKP